MRCGPEMNPEGIYEMSKVIKTQPFQRVPWSVHFCWSDTVVWRIPPPCSNPSWPFWTTTAFSRTKHCEPLACTYAHSIVWNASSPSPYPDQAFHPRPSAPSQSVLLLSSLNPLSPNPSRVSSRACCFRKWSHIIRIQVFLTLSTPFWGGHLAFSTL